VLGDRRRWPDHICYFDFMQKSIEMWTSRVVRRDSLATRHWTDYYPLPIGEEVLKRRFDEYGDCPDDTLMKLLPFEGEEEALWALRVENAHSVLDMFGLKGWTPPGDATRNYLWLGGFAYSLHGHDDTSLVELVRDGEKWWRNLSRERIQGRPRGSGTWESPGHFKRELRGAGRELHVRGLKVTQETVAELFQTNDRVLRRWLSDNNIDWREVKKTL